MKGKTLLQRRENLLRHGRKLRLGSSANNVKVRDAFKFIEVEPGTNSLLTTEQVRDLFR